MTVLHKIENFDGVFSLQIVEDLLAKAEGYLRLNGTETILLKRIYSVLVECLSNVYRHGSNRQELLSINKMYPPHFSFEDNETEYMILTSNVIFNSEIPDLRKKLDHIMNQDKESLKDLYKNKVLSGSISERGGADLGLITIGKMSISKLWYNFEPLDDNHCNFKLSITITK